MNQKESVATTDTDEHARPHEFQSGLVYHVVTKKPFARHGEVRHLFAFILMHWPALRG
jgi:hypothetical protein